MDLLIKKIIEKGNPTVAGLDPILDYIPNYLKEQSIRKYGKTPSAAADAILEFNKGLIDALCNIVPAVKPQSAYYEMYGWQGIDALIETIEYAKGKGMYVIVDAKRNDIGSTATAYSAAYIGNTDVFGNQIKSFGADALTVNGYLGSDGVMPFVKDCEQNNKDIFVLVKTSNPSSGELQDIKTEDGEEVYIKMSQLVKKWGENLIGGQGFSSVGAVVGATYPEELTKLRQLMSQTFFLVPGYGAQGGGAKDIAGAFNENGLGAIINSSRAIMCAYKKENNVEQDYMEAARNEAVRMKNDIINAIK